MEYCDGGNLFGYLSQNNLDPNFLCQSIKDIVSGNIPFSNIFYFKKEFGIYIQKELFIEILVNLILLLKILSYFFK